MGDSEHSLLGKAGETGQRRRVGRWRRACVGGAGQGIQGGTCLRPGGNWSGKGASQPRQPGFFAFVLVC